MDINTIAAQQLVIDAWAEVPEHMNRDEFRLYLINLGNHVGEFDPEQGERGSFHIGTLTPDPEEG